ncbi:hypothetical protein CAPTEDRAFT_185190 [Capitella teleta]|uniref:Male-enhanced antigen 1 n=1 Tax=Capitella teleta TaxID=283909 RepID=R7TUL9_CAPTE|nr:hypothetical protein CAPTEDRAFT_185190 [Capitella teleta]|eukprot:ELT97364.1 hypothetical protein CAPTEDRAFT_185190 [Capitella teleta]
MAPSPNPKHSTKDDDQELRNMEMPPQHIINAVSDSDDSSSASSDDEDPSHMGYQLLPQEPPSSIPLSNRSPNEQRAEQVVSSLHTDHVEQELWKTLEPGSGFVPSASSSAADPALFPESSTGTKEAEERRELWNEAKKIDSGLPEGAVDAIRNAMCGFSLPDSHIPSWANALEEQQWKSQLLDRLQKNDKK